MTLTLTILLCNQCLPSPASCKRTTWQLACLSYQTISTHFMSNVLTSSKCFQIFNHLLPVEFSKYCSMFVPLFANPPKTSKTGNFCLVLSNPFTLTPNHRFPPLLGKVKNPPPRWERCRVAPERARLWLHHGNSCPLLGSFLQGSGIKKIFELPPSSNCCFCGYRFGDVV